MVLRYGPVISWALLIFIVSSIPNLSTPEITFKIKDKVAHCIEFGIFGYFLASALYPFGVRLTIRKVATILTISFMYSVLDEIYQTFIPGREADVYDVAANALGVCVAVIVWYYVRRKRSSVSCEG